MKGKDILPSALTLKRFLRVEMCSSRSRYHVLVCRSLYIHQSARVLRSYRSISAHCTHPHRLKIEVRLIVRLAVANRERIEADAVSMLLNQTSIPPHRCGRAETGGGVFSRRSRR